MAKFLNEYQTVAQYIVAKNIFLLPHISKIDEEDVTVVYNPQISVKNAVVTCDNAIYNGETQIAQNIIVIVDGKMLAVGSDYTITGNNGGVNTGNYNFTINGINNYIGSKTCTFTINKVTPTVTIPTAKVLTYNTQPQVLANEGSTDFGTLKYSLNGVEWSTNVPSRTYVGSYGVYYKVEGDNNVNGTDPSIVACSINEKAVTATVEVSQSTYTYDSSAKEPTVTVKDGDVIIPSNEYTVSYSNNTNAGTATVTIIDNVGGNYNVIGSTTFTIEKANPSYTAPTATSPVYNGSSQNLLNAGSTSDGTIQYSTDGSTWSTTIPSQTNVNTYASYWKLVGDNNHVDIDSTSIDTTIEKVTPIVVAPTPNVLTYNTESQELVVAGSTDYGTMKYSLDNSTWTTTVPSATNYGAYTVYYRVDGDSNINDVAASSIQASIAEKRVTTPTIELSQSVYTYDNTAKQPTVTVKDGTTVIPSSEYTVEYSNNTNAGTATVTISDNVDGNYYVSGTTTFTINKVTPTVTAPTAKSLTYNGSVQTLLNAGSTNWGTLKYSSDGTNYSTTIPSATNANTYGLYYKVEGNSNINDVSPIAISATIAKAAGTATVNGVSLTYNASARNLVTVSNNTGTMHYKVGTGSWGTAIPTSTNVGSWTIYYYMDASTNYNDIASASTKYVSSSIAKADQAAPTATGATTTYNTTATATAGGGGKQGSIEWSNGNTQTSVGSKSTKARWSGNGNYNASPWSNAVTVQMNKAAGSVSTKPTAKSLTYNGTSRAIINAGSGTGTMMYKLGSGSWGTAIPSATTAGSYTVYYKASASTNYNESSSGSVSVTIAKAAGSVSTKPTAKSLTYTGSAQALVNAGSGTGTMYYRLGTSGSFSTSIPTRTDVGNYTVYYYAAASTNYNQSSTGSVSVTINEPSDSRTVYLWAGLSEYNAFDDNRTVPSRTGSVTIPSDKRVGFIIDTSYRNGWEPIYIEYKSGTKVLPEDRIGIQTAGIMSGTKDLFFICGPDDTLTHGTGYYRLYETVKSGDDFVKNPSKPFGSQFSVKY